MLPCKERIDVSNESKSFIKRMLYEIVFVIENGPRNQNGVVEVDGQLLDLVSGENKRDHSKV